jgi:hypothetical protein
MHPQYVLTSLLTGDVITDVSHGLIVPRRPTEAVVSAIKRGDYESVTGAYVIRTYNATVLEPTPENSVTGVPCLPFIFCFGRALDVRDVLTKASFQETARRPYWDRNRFELYRRESSNSS